MKKFTVLLAFFALVLTACEIGNPSTRDVVPSSWGTNIQPARSNVPYIAGANRGCGAGTLQHERCGGSQTLDIYPAAIGGNKGTIVIIHGGGFVGGNKYPLEPLGLVNRQNHLGWNLVSVDYRLARDGRNMFPTAIQDVAAALRWLRARGAEYGLNTSRLVVVGFSAGGGLSGLVGTAANSGRPEFAGIPPISGWVSFAGIHDFTIPGMTSFWGQSWMGGNFGSQRTTASPITWLDPSDPKGYLVHGDLDNLVETLNSRRMREKADRFGFADRVELDIVDFFDNGSSTGDARGHNPAGGTNATNFQSWLDALPSVDQFANPFGTLDGVPRSTPTVVTAAGWAIDPDTKNPVDVHIYVNNRFAASGKANASRPDVGAAYPLYGPNHGYNISVNARPGDRVCAFAINLGIGTTNPSLGCRTAS